MPSASRVGFFNHSGMPVLNLNAIAVDDDARSDATASSGDQCPDDGRNKSKRARLETAERSREMRESLARSFVIRPIPDIETLEESDEQSSNYSRILRNGEALPQSVLARAFFKQLVEMHDVSDRLLEQVALAGEGDLQGGKLISPKIVK